MSTGRKSLNSVARAGVMVLGVATVLGICAGVARSEASIVLQALHPIEGETVQLYVQDGAGAAVPGATVNVIYRPGSSVEQSDTVGTTGPNGRLDWNPAMAGIATLAAAWVEEGSEVSIQESVSVRFAAVPVTGIIIMIFAGLLLVGGSAVRIMKVIST